MFLKRRILWVISVLATLVLIASSVGMAGVVADSDSQPNILLIITDQQHAGMMSCAGESHVRTPALDRLAASGTRFEMAYATNPVCIPSRVSMMTGRMPSYFGMRSNAEGKSQAPADELKRAMGWIFRQAGYQTVYGGKTHWLRGMDPNSIGFERLSDDEREGLAKECAKFLHSEHDKPFFLVASFINPHDICYMAIDDFTKATGKPLMYPHSEVERQRLAVAMQFPNGVSEEQFFELHAPPIPSNFEIPPLEPQCITERYVRPAGYLNYARTEWSAERWRLYRWAYRRLTEMVDAQIGQLLDALDDSGLAGSTVVVFTSDHGDMDAAHRMEHKSVLYEEAARVPLIVRDPSGCAPFAVDNLHPISVGLDLIPTLCDYAQVEPPADLLGISIKPLVGGKPVSFSRDHVVVESKAGRMIRTGRFKYVVYEDGEHREQLTDLATDPGEMANLAEDPKYRNVLVEHQRLLHRWVVDTNDEMAKAYIVSP